MAPRKTKEEIQKDMEDIETALSFDISNLERIGPVKAKKLNSHGIKTAQDLVIVGAPQLAFITQESIEQATKWVESAREFLRSKNIIQKSRIGGLDYLNYRTKTVQYLQTGVENFDEILGGGFESGVMTEFYGVEGSGKTQICMLSAILAQFPYKRRCFNCKKMFDDQKIDRCPDCEVKTIRIGGLSEEGKPCRVLYMDTENSYRPERVLEIIKERGLVKTKEQTAMEKKRGAEKQFLNEEEKQKAFDIVDNIEILKVTDSAQQLMVAEELASFIEEEGKPPVKLLIIDSITGEFRLDYIGRGEISGRQDKLKEFIRYVVRLAEVYNIVVLITNQVLKDPGVGMGDPTKPIGGMTLAHKAKHIIYLKPKKLKGRHCAVALLTDSPNLPKNECVLALTKKGIENGEKAEAKEESGEDSGEEAE